MNNKIVILVLIATFFGLLSGMVGQIISRAYFLEKDFNMPLFSDIHFANDQNDTSLIIRNPKKIVVEQSLKAQETKQAVQGSIMGIFLKKENDGLINLKNRKGDAFVITSDGWMISAFSPPGLINIKNQEASSSQKNILNMAQKYVFISKDNKNYEVEEILYDPISTYSFWKVNAKDLPVRKLESFLKKGDLVFEINFSGDILTNTVVTRKKKDDILFSDIFEDEILLAYKRDELNNSFIFNSYGDLVALSDENGKVISIYSFNSLIHNLLKNKSIKRPSLGVNYINNFNIFNLELKETGKGAEISKDKKGIAVLKGSPAEKAGLKEGDIILSLNGVDLLKDKNLQELLNTYLPGDELKIDYLRGDKKFFVALKLGAF